MIAKYKVILSTDSLNAFLERLPRDMLFVMRTSDLVRSLNKVRGRQRGWGMGVVVRRKLS